MTNLAQFYRNQNPGATVVGRGRKHIRFAHPTVPGRFIIENPLVPIHFGPGLDQEIDTAWVNTVGGDEQPWLKKMHMADYNAYAFPGTTDFDAGQIIKYIDPYTGNSIAFQPQQLEWVNSLLQSTPISGAQKVQGVTLDNTITWSGAYGAGTSFDWRASGGRIMKVLVLDNIPAGIPLPGDERSLRLQFIFQKSNGVDIWVNGTKWDERASNPVATTSTIEFRNAQGDTLWAYRPATAWDSAGNTVTPVTKIRKQGNSLLVEVWTPYTWLLTAVYPVFIDPTIDTTVTDGDDDASERANDTSFEGTNTVLRYSSHATSNYKVGTRFDGVGAISNGDTIDVCYLTLTAINAGNDDMNGVFHFEDVDSPANFATDADVANRVLTTASVPWVADGLGTSPVNTPSLVTPAQEVVDLAGFGGVMMVIFVGDTDVTKNFFAKSYENGADIPALHVEYTEAGGPSTAIKEMILSDGILPWSR